MKQGGLGGAQTFEVQEFEVPRDLHKLKPPPNAKAFVIKPEEDLAYYEVEHDDGTLDKYYAAVPFYVVSTFTRFADPPARHLGQDIEDSTVENLSALYLTYLRWLVEAARSEFGTGVPPSHNEETT